MDEVNHRLASLFKNLGNGIRVEILSYLRNRDEAFLGEIADQFDRTSNTMSRHMKILTDYNLVQAKTKGRKKYFRIKRERLVDACLKIRQHLMRDNDTS